eukprot:gnl/TRDRNA2_/TRDRNA2_167401_c4_seq1.p2 gnl/TRDRNA2_/TRDRNA2_167401_c4~~gnl/TRDRNA2_/TRDRNA2_167401_c4_seq1.p2  ORF type:complete len:102 (+),score=9.16 gnl/TRDRNA2_/TRDRNA2_167401_c4_seq1:11-316(+)
MGDASLVLDSAGMPASAAMGWLMVLATSSAMMAMLTTVTGARLCASGSSVQRRPHDRCWNKLVVTLTQWRDFPALMTSKTHHSPENPAGSLAGVGGKKGVR